MIPMVGVEPTLPKEHDFESQNTVHIMKSTTTTVIELFVFSINTITDYYASVPQNRQAPN